MQTLCCEGSFEEMMVLKPSREIRYREVWVPRFGIAVINKAIKKSVDPDYIARTINENPSELKERLINKINVWIK